jgi:hypothetical protein
MIRNTRFLFEEKFWNEVANVFGKLRSCCIVVDPKMLYHRRVCWIWKIFSFSFKWEKLAFTFLCSNVQPKKCCYVTLFIFFVHKLNYALTDLVKMNLFWVNNTYVLRTNSRSVRYVDYYMMLRLLIFFYLIPKLLWQCFILIWKLWSKLEVFPGLG